MNNINKASASASVARSFYEEHDIGEDLKIRLADEAKLLIGARRRSTEEAFESGERLDRVALLLPEGTVEKWAVECCGYTSRHIRTMRAVSRNLNAYKQILVDLAVGPTVLGKLSAASPEQVEQAIGFAGMHGRCGCRTSRQLSPGRSRTSIRSRKLILTMPVGSTGPRRSSPSRCAMG